MKSEEKCVKLSLPKAQQEAGTLMLWWVVTALGLPTSCCSACEQMNTHWSHSYNYRMGFHCQPLKAFLNLPSYWMYSGGLLQPSSNFSCEISVPFQPILIFKCCATLFRTFSQVSGLNHRMILVFSWCEWNYLCCSLLKIKVGILFKHYILFMKGTSFPVC